MTAAYAILVAGGSGTRMNAALPKQFLELQGKTILQHSIAAFLQAIPSIQIIVVLPEAYLSKGADIISQHFPEANIRLTSGGDTRFHSVYNGLQLIQEPGVVLVHDAVRCMVTANLIQHCFETALLHQSAVPAIAVNDSIRRTDASGNYAMDRSALRAIQTPQAFDIDWLQAAFSHGYRPEFTDEASVIEAAGGQVQLVEGETTNIKITQPLDLLIAEGILNQRNQHDS